MTEVVNHIDKRVSEPISKIRIQLYHVHLPKLDDKNWLTYSAETGNIQYHGHEKADYLIGEVSDMF